VNALSNNPSKFPPISDELMKKLEELWPDKLPRGAAVTIENLRVLQGNREVIDHIRSHFQRQNTTILKGN